MNKSETVEIIHAAGGVSAFARLLGLDPAEGGKQRVSNWKRRGLPAEVELEHYDKIQQLRQAKATRRAARASRTS